MTFTFRMFEGMRDWAWVKEKINLLRVEDTGGIVAEDEHGNLVAACMWDSWTNTTAQCHLCIDNKLVLRHGFLEECSDFLFHHAKRTKLYGLVPGNNIKALRLNTKLGFTVKSVLEDGFDVGVDYILMECLAQNFKFYRPLEKVA